MDADGIDWNAFNGKRKKRRIVFWLFSLLSLVLVGGLYLMFNYEGESKLSKKSTTSSPVSSFEPNTSNVAKSEDPETYANADKQISYENDKQSKVVKEKTVWPENPAVEEKAVHSEEPPTKENITEKQEIRPISPEEINVYSKPIPDLFTYTKPVYTAEKISENLRPSPVFNIKKSKLYWEIQAGPSLNIPNFHVTPSGKPFVHKDYEYIRKTSESAVSGYNFQMAIGKSVNRWNYSMGFGFSSFYMMGNYDFSYSDKPVIDVDGKIKSYLQSSPASIRFTSKQSLSFIEIPLNIQYTVIDKPKFSAGLRLGYVNQFLTGINGQLPNAVFLDERENLTTENFKLRTSCLESGLQFLYKINKKSGLILMPEYRRGLGFNQVQTYYKTNFNYWGLNLCYRAAL